MCYQIDPEGPEPLPPPAHERAALPSTMSVAIPVDERSALVNQIVKQNLYRVRDKQIKGGLFKTLIDLDIRRNGSIYTRTRNGKKSPCAGGRGPGTRPAGLLATAPSAKTSSSTGRSTNSCRAISIWSKTASTSIFSPGAASPLACIR